jgi:Abnormal spindle-like microcephaly-assoc'd, ASPM-SPD-2-Hydin
VQDVPSNAASRLHSLCCCCSGFRRSSSKSVPAVWMAFLLLAIVHLAGCGVSYNTVPLTVNPGSLSFGTVPVGQTQSQAITLQNMGLNSVTLSGMQVADPAFAISPAQTTTTIPAGGTASLKVTFTPTAVKTYSSQVVVTSGGQNTNISVSGTGQQSTPQAPSGSAALQLSATALQFGSVPIGGDAQQSLTMTSTGTAPLTISSLNAQGGAFSAQSPALPLTLQPGQKLTLPVKFGPKASGGETGQLVIASNAAAAPSVTVNLIGNGEGPAPPPPATETPALTLSSTAVKFGSVAVGSHGSSSVTLTSSGTAAVVLQSVAVSGTGFSTGQLHLPLTLAPGQQIALPLSFNPASAGAQQGQVTLTDNATGSPNTISLTGTGTTTASLSVPTSLDFGDVTVGSEGDKTITLVSNGTGSVTVNAITVAGASFAGSIQALPQVLQPNQQMSVKLKFDPKAAGNATGTVTVSSNSPSNPSSVVQIHGNGVVATSPALSASASSLSFGQVPLNSPATKTVTVTSTGTAPATISGGNVTGTGYTARYAGVPVQNISAPITLQPGQVVTFSVAFDPTAAGASNGQLSLATDTGSPVNVSLTGTGVQNTSPALTVSAPSLNFGDVQMGSKATLQLTLTSSGTAPVTISSGTIAGQAFGISSVAYPAGITGWPATLNPGQQVVLSIAFAPDSATSFTGDLAVASNASGGTANVPLNGTGDAVPAPNLTLSTTSIDFGQSAIGTKVSRTLTLTSSGNAPLNVNTITVSGAMFSVGTVTLPATLQPGQQLPVTVTFDPTTAATDAGTLTVTSDDPSGPATVSLGGLGTTTTTPQLTVSPTAVSFGNVPLNVASTQPVTLTSTGSAPVTINAATVTGAGFSVTGANFPVTLKPNQAVTLQVQFDPTTAGAASGQMTVTSDSTTGATTQVTLSGAGTVAAVSQLTVSAGSLSFGNVTVNSTATLPVTLTSSGTAPLTITAATVGGADFTDSGATFPVTLNPNTSVTLQVKFNPTAAGGVTGQLTIASNSAGGSPTQVTLSGTGTAAPTAQLQVSATSLPFGSVPVNSTSTLTLTLISSGTAPVTVNSVGLTGTGFSDSGATFPVTLNPNKSATLNVQFDPTVAGAATGQLTITSTSTTGSTTQIPLTGTGTAVTYSISLNWDAPSGSTDPVAGYNVYRSTDGGASFTKLNTSPDSQADYSDATVQSGTTYVYQVTSVDASGVESAPSNQFPLSVP